MDGSDQNGEGLVVKGSVGRSAHSWLPAYEQTAGEVPSLCGLLLPGERSPYSSLITLKDFTLTCWSVCAPCFSMDNTRPLKQAYWTLALFLFGGELSQVKATTQHALGPLCHSPFLS